MEDSGKSEISAVHPVLAARDVSSSVEFYRRLGFELIFLDSRTEPRYAAVARDGVELHLQWTDPLQWVAGLDRPVYRFLVQDVDALFRELADAGCAGSSGAGESPWAVPADTPWGTREFHLRDPGGNGLQFYRPLSGGGEVGMKAPRGLAAAFARVSVALSSGFTGGRRESRGNRPGCS